LHFKIQNIPAGFIRNIHYFAIGFHNGIMQYMENKNSSNFSNVQKSRFGILYYKFETEYLNWEEDTKLKGYRYKTKVVKANSGLSKEKFRTTTEVTDWQAGE